MNAITRPHADLAVAAVGLALAGTIAGIDLALGGHGVVIGAILVAPILCVVLGSSRATRLVALSALLLAAASGLWRHDLASGGFLIRTLAVAAGSALSMVAARDRGQGELASQRMTMLMRLADVGQSHASVEATVARICDVLVPELADACMIDAVRSEVAERIGVRASGPQAQECEAFLRRRGPEPVSAEVSFTAEVAGGEPVLIPDIDDELFAHWARDQEDLAGLRALGTRSAIVLPLRSREQLVGVLTVLLTEDSGRRYGPSELRFASILAGRVALALDNAGLTRQLGELDRRLAGALGSLLEAVIVQDGRGSVVYANDQARKLAGLARGVAFDIQALRQNLSIFDANGTSLRFQDLPAGALLAGHSEAEPMLVRAVLQDLQQERWLLAKSSLLADEHGGPPELVTIFEDVTDWQRVESARRLLGEVSGALASSLDYEDSLHRIADLVAQALADWCTVSISAPANGLSRVAVAVADEARTPGIRQMLERQPPGSPPDGPQMRVMGEGKPLMVNDIHAEGALTGLAEGADQKLLPDTKLGAVLMVPLIGAGSSIGVLTLMRTQASPAFSEFDLTLAQEIGRRAGGAIENARLYTERMRISSLLQEALRPPTLAATESWALATLYEPAGDDSEVGGDFYDFFAVPGGHMAVIGDVTGHGAIAARTTALARHTLRTAAELTGDPVAAIGQLNRALCAAGDLSLATALCILLSEAEDGRALVRVVVAGHPLPLLRSSEDAYPIGRHGLLLGYMPEASWVSTDLAVEAGQTLMLYTDGVIETRGPSELFGEARLIDCVRQAPPDPVSLLAQVRRHLLAFRELAAEDDTAMLALQVNQPTAGPAIG